MGHSLGERLELTSDRVESMELPHGRARLISTDGVVSGADRRFFVILPETHILPDQVGRPEKIPDEVRALQKAVFEDADHILSKFKITNLVLEQPDQPFFSKARKLAPRRKDVDRLIREERSVAEQEKREPHAPLFEAWMRTALYPDSTLASRRAALPEMKGNISTWMLLEGLYGDAQGIRVLGEPSELHKKRTKVIDTLFDLMNKVRQNKVGADTREGRIPILVLKQRALAGDQEAKVAYQRFRRDYVEKYVKPAIAVGIHEADRVVAGQCALAQGNSLMVYGANHATGLAKHLKSVGNVILVEHDPLLLEASRQGTKVKNESIEDIHSEAGFINYVLGFLPDLD